MDNFKCKKCGKCCSNLLPLCEEDIKRIKEFGSLLKENKLLLDKEWYMICPFLNFSNECDIYEDRPEICKAFTCDRFNNHRYDNRFIELLKTTNFKLTDMRKTFFGERK